MTNLDDALWATVFVEDIILCFVLAAKRRARSFPTFSALIAFDIVRTLALFAIERTGDHATYFYTYWALGAIDIALQLGVLYEVASKAFRPRGKWATDTTGALVCLLFGSIATATFLAWMPHPVVVLPVQWVILKASFFSAMLISELLVGLLAMSVWAGLSWPLHSARVVHGLVGYSLCTLALETARIYCGVTQGSRAYGDLSRLRITAYVICMAYWIVSLWLDPPLPRELSGRMREQLSAIGHAVAGRVAARRDEVRP